MKEDYAFIHIDKLKKLDNLEKELSKYKKDAKGFLKFDKWYGTVQYLSKNDALIEIEEQVNKSERLLKAYKETIDNLSQMSNFKFLLWKRSYPNTPILPTK